MPSWVGVPSRADIEQLSLAEVSSLAGVPLPAERDRSMEFPCGLALVAAFVGAIALVGLWERELGRAIGPLGPYSAARPPATACGRPRGQPLASPQARQRALA